MPRAARTRRPPATGGLPHPRPAGPRARQPTWVIGSPKRLGAPVTSAAPRSRRPWDLYQRRSPGERRRWASRGAFVGCGGAVAAEQRAVAPASTRMRPPSVPLRTATSGEGVRVWAVDAGLAAAASDHHGDSIGGHRTLNLPAQPLRLLVRPAVLGAGAQIPVERLPCLGEDSRAAGGPCRARRRRGPPCRDRRRSSRRCEAFVRKVACDRRPQQSAGSGSAGMASWPLSFLRRTGLTL